MQGFDQVKVEVRRGNEKIHVEVPSHEVIVLRAVHRPEHVSVLGPHKRQVQLDPSAGAEFARLRRKYSTKDHDPVRHAFPLGEDMLREFGFSQGEAIVSEPDGAGVIDHEELRERAAAEASVADADKKAAGKK